MKKYIKPTTIKVKLIELENYILAGSVDIGISDDPATDPALSKGGSFFDDEEDEEPTTTLHSSSSLWND